MPTVNLGRVRPIYKGVYSAGSVYFPLDFVKYNGNTYFCTATTTGNDPSNGAYWQALSNNTLADLGVSATAAELDGVVSNALRAGNNLSDVASKPKSLATLRGFTSTVTSAGTTTLTAASSATQRFTGTTTQTVVLPDTTTLIAGWVYEIVNASTDALTVNSSGGNLVVIIPAGTSASLRCVLASGTTAASWAVVLATGSAPNLAHNPCGTVNQRGYVSGTATTAANQFTLDRWFVLVSGQNLTFTGDNSYRIMTAPAGGVGQVRLGRNIRGGTYVMNWVGTATLTVNGTARAKGEAFTLTANTNAKIVFYSGTFTEVKWELGTVPTPFATPDYEIELKKCEYYWRKLGGTLAKDIFVQGAGSTTVALAATLPFPRMARAPTGAKVGPWDTYNSAQPSIVATSDHSIVINAAGTVATIGQMVYGTASLATYLTLDAEFTS